MTIRASFVVFTIAEAEAIRYKKWGELPSVGISKERERDRYWLHCIYYMSLFYSMEGTGREKILRTST